MKKSRYLDNSQETFIKMHTMKIEVVHIFFMRLS